MTLSLRSEVSQTPIRISRLAVVSVLGLALMSGGAVRHGFRSPAPNDVAVAAGGVGGEPAAEKAQEAPPAPRLIRSVRNFASLQVVNVKEKPYNKMIAAAAKQHHIDPALIRAVIHVESNFAPRAKSRVGARGLMQLMPATARELGVKRSGRLNDPRVNIQAGAAYLSALAEIFGETNADLIIAAYNAGPGAVRKWGGIPPYPETQEYVRKVAALWGQPAGEADLVIVTA